LSPPPIRVARPPAKITPAMLSDGVMVCLFRLARTGYQAGYQGETARQRAAMTALAYVIGDGRGAVDLLLAEVAKALTAQGVALAGVVQVNSETQGAVRCDMDLQVLGRPETVRISQRLGNAARGCRLDQQGLEAAVGLVGASLAEKSLLIVNKFGKTEVEGRGFRPLIASALEQEMPVLVGLNRDNLAGFHAFAEGLGTEIPAEFAAILDWCRTQVPQTP